MLRKLSNHITNLENVRFTIDNFTLIKSATLTLIRNE